MTDEFDEQEKQWRRQLGVMKRAARRHNDFEQYLLWHEPEERLEAFVRLSEELEDRTYWQLLAEVWRACDAPHTEADMWTQLLRSPREGREAMMSPQEREALAALPELVSIYLGVGRRELVDRLSWTLDRAAAEQVARRFECLHNAPLLACGSVARKDILAYLCGRRGAEIVAFPEHVALIEAVELPPSDLDSLPASTNPVGLVGMHAAALTV